MQSVFVIHVQLAGKHTVGTGRRNLRSRGQGWGQGACTSERPGAWWWVGAAATPGSVTVGVSQILWLLEGPDPEGLSHISVVPVVLTYSNRQINVR